MDREETAETLELELFGIRKSVLAKPLLRLTLKSKLARLDQLAEIAAAQGLFGDIPTVPFLYDFRASDEVLALWESYMKAKSAWKMAVMQAYTPLSLKAVLEDGLQMERAFSEQFPVGDWIDEDPVFGLEPDPMLIQSGLKQAVQNGWHTFADLEKNKSALEKDLLLAIKRLSLLPKYL